MLMKLLYIILEGLMDILYIFFIFFLYNNIEANEITVKRKINTL